MDDGSQTRRADGMSLAIGIVGCGAVSRIYYAGALAALAREDPEVQVSALFDPQESALHPMAALFPKATAHRTWDSFRAATPDLAIVASPPACHAQQAVELLEAGAAVLCEKPLASSLAEAEAIVAAAERPGAVLAVGMVRRYLPAAKAIRWLLRSGALGALQRIRWLEGGRFRWPVESLDYFRPEVGGVLSDIGVHVLDLLQWWLGPLALESYADDRAGGIEANCLIRLRHGDDAEIAVRLTRDDDPPTLCRIDCERGTILWREGHPTDIEVLPGRMNDKDASLLSLMTAAQAEVGSFERSFVAQLQDLIAARRRGGQAPVTARSALAAVALIDACHAARRSLPMPWLTPEEDEAYAQLAGSGPEAAP